VVVEAAVLVEVENEDGPIPLRLLALGSVPAVASLKNWSFEYVIESRAGSRGGFSIPAEQRRST
jgi:hypothetical protein